jgi:hypothetical protein
MENKALLKTINDICKRLKGSAMKKAFFLVILLIACKDEDSVDPDKPSNFFEYEGLTYPLENGWIKHIDNPGWGFNHTIISLYSSGVSWDNDAGDFIGKGHSIHITFRRSGEELVEGIYNYQSSTEGPYSLTLSTTSFSIDWDWGDNTGLYGYFREGSVVEITKEDGNYSITFTLIPTLTLGNIENDSPVTGIFSGALTTIY